MPQSVEIREALRTVYTCAPEAAALIEVHMDRCDERIVLLTNENAFKAFVLAQAQQAGAAQSVMERIENSILSDLAAAAKHRAAADHAQAEAAKHRALTLKGLMTQPVALAMIGVLSTFIGIAGNVILRLLGVG